MMRISIERLRAFLLVGAGLLVIVVAGFLVYGHMRAHRFLRDLPGRLGVDITRESNDFTWSQSSKGKTVYTIHAARMVQHKDGKTVLRDVGIVLYGQKGDRVDRISGNEFEYDQAAGVVRAAGEVHLDLQAPAPADARGRAEYAAGRGPAAEKNSESDERIVHVKTSGLTFVQKLGVASTREEIEFQYHGMHGQAKGADFNSDTGVTVLQSEVRVSGLRNGAPVLLTAAHAEMDRSKEQMTLERAHYVSIEDGASKGGGQTTVEAGQALVQLTRDGGLEHVWASGGASLERAGGRMTARNAEVAMGEGNRPESARMSGEVRYAAEGSLREVQGSAAEGTVRFDGAGRVSDAVMTGAAEVRVRERATVAGPWSERKMAGERLEGRFAPAGERTQWLREAVATGNARMLLVERGTKAGETRAGETQAGETTSELRGDVLTAEMTWDGRRARPEVLRGTGHTTLRRRDADGGEDTSEGETLEVSFGSAAEKGPSSKAGVGLTSVSRAVQRGGVVLTRLPAKKDGVAPSPMRATAREAVWEGEGERLTLTGQTEVEEGESLLRADAVTVERGTGDATATGSVRASYRQAGSAEPVRVQSARAEMQHKAGVATFFGSPGVPARLWQGGSQVEAAVIELNQTKKTLAASTGGARGEVVRTVLVSAGKESAGVAKSRPQVMRVASGSLRYSDGDRRALFGGGVVVEGADGTIRSPEVLALLKPAGTGAAGTAAAGAFLGGSVDRVTAEGGVEVTEPGRRGSGDRLVYTADDGMFVMTGTPAAPPRVVDELEGTVTGAALQFHAGDNSVMVLGKTKDGLTRRVETETAVRKRR